MHRFIIWFLLGLSLLAGGCSATLPPAHPNHASTRTPVVQVEQVEQVEHVDQVDRVEGPVRPPADSLDGSVEATPAFTDGDPIVLILALGGVDASDEAHEIYEEQYQVLYECLGDLSPDIDGEVMARVYIDERSEVTAVSIGWRIGFSENQSTLPDPLGTYVDAAECIEAALLHTQVLLADAGEQALLLEFSVR